MSIITIIGSGMMGSALAFPARENGNEVRLVGTPLDREIIDGCRKNGQHLKFDRPFPAGLRYFQFEEVQEALKETDLIICGVSSFGVDWFADRVLPLLPSGVPVLSVTKGLLCLEDGTLQCYPQFWQKQLDRLGKDNELCAIGGPCTSYELVAHDQTLVSFCGKNKATLERLRAMMTTSYYHIATTTDVMGIESAVALKNGYALGIALTIGENFRRAGNEEEIHYNSQAGVFQQAAKEMHSLILRLGGTEESFFVGNGDLYVTVYGGRTRKVGILLGEGLTIDESLERLKGVTLESLVVASRVAKALKLQASQGKIRLEEYPLLMHVDSIITDRAPVAIPWEKFTGSHESGAGSTDAALSEARFRSLLKQQTLLDPGLDLRRLAPVPGMEHHVVQMPDEFLFLHEAAVIAFHGTMYAAWYNNPERELNGFTPIRERRSADGGKTWGPVRTIAGNEGDRFLYCPPVFGIQDDTLYLFLNRMVSADHIHCMDLYRLDEATGKFGLEKSWNIPFKLNTNLYTLPDGKLFLPGRIAEKQDDFPLYPAGLISDSGRVDGEWRPVWFSGKKLLPDGRPYGHAECSAVVQGKDVYVFCREDTHEAPLLFVSRDCGESWEGPIAHDIPFTNSKIYSGTLSDGRNYVIGNIPPWRDTLAIFFSEPGTMRFTSGGIIHQGYDPERNLYPQWSYPVACESDGKLYVICTMQAVDPAKNIRGAILSVIPLR